MGQCEGFKMKRIALVVLSYALTGCITIQVQASSPATDAEASAVAERAVNFVKEAVDDAMRSLSQNCGKACQQ